MLLDQVPNDEGEGLPPGPFPLQNVEAAIKNVDDVVPQSPSSCSCYHVSRYCHPVAVKELAPTSRSLSLRRSRPTPFCLASMLWAHENPRRTTEHTNKDISLIVSATSKTRPKTRTSPPTLTGVSRALLTESGTEL